LVFLEFGELISKKPKNQSITLFIKMNVLCGFTMATIVGGKNMCKNYTLLFFGGRQPLCGNGVTSVIVVTSIPDVDILRIAPSRPPPGPFTNTSARFMPASIATFAQSAAAN
jgi:hypothetical protein